MHPHKVVVEGGIPIPIHSILREQQQPHIDRLIGQRLEQVTIIMKMK
jgi:hypothetical protein